MRLIEVFRSAADKSIAGSRAPGAPGAVTQRELSAMIRLSDARNLTMARIACKLLVLTCSLLLAAAAWAGETFWIDVRTAEEFAAGHVTGAVNIQISSRITEVSDDHDAEIYLYCRSGRRADIAKAALEEMGYTKVVNLRTVAAARDKAVQLSRD